MSSPSALMPCCRVKHQEKLYYTELVERRQRGTEGAGVERGSVREKHKWEWGDRNVMLEAQLVTNHVLIVYCHMSIAFSHLLFNSGFFPQ